MTKPMLSTPRDIEVAQTATSWKILLGRKFSPEFTNEQSMIRHAKASADEMRRPLLIYGRGMAGGVECSAIVARVHPGGRFEYPTPIEGSRDRAKPAKLSK